MKPPDEGEPDESISDEGVIPRPAVERFSLIMEQALIHNDHKGGWDDSDTSILFNRLTDEITELADAIMDGDWEMVEKEAADVANFAMMISDPDRREDKKA